MSGRGISVDAVTADFRTEITIYPFGVLGQRWVGVGRVSVPAQISLKKINNLQIVRSVCNLFF